MQLNPESQAVLEKLYKDQSVSASSTKVGPFDQVTKDVLNIIIGNYEPLNSQTGESRAKFFLAKYKSLLEDRKTTEGNDQENIPEIEPKQTEPENIEHSQWYIHNVECHSIRGIDSYGNTFSFSFEGKSNLIYGPNGSGKSSLLGAVIWAFTGICITDASDEAQETDIHQKTDGTKKGRRIRSNWPTISTLPDTDIERIATPNSWVMVELKSKDQAKTLFIKRSLAGLEAGEDKDNLKPCNSLEKYGIKPIDLQISLIAPTVLGRNTLDKVDSVIEILSMILGVDALDDIGGLAKNIGTNRTTYASNIQRNINITWRSLGEILLHLADRLNENSLIRVKLKDIIAKDKPTLPELTDKQTLIQEEIEAAEKNVAELLGVDTSSKEMTEGIYEKLIEAIAYLEKGVEAVFPSLVQVKYNAVQQGDKTVDKIEDEFSAFGKQAQKRIEQRINWWKREKHEGRKLSLKLLASSDYDVEKMTCPVCEQSIKILPIKAELEKLKTLDTELQRKLTDFFNDLSGELKKTVPEHIRNICTSSPLARILADWQKINTTLDKRLQGVVGQYNPHIQSLCDSIEGIPVEPVIFFDDKDDDLITASNAFIKEYNDSLWAIEILKWGDIHYESIKAQLDKLITSCEDTSLLSELSKSKAKAADIGPLKTIKTQLGEIIKLRETITGAEAEHGLLESLRSPLDEIKKLSKYSLEKTEQIFNEIKTASDKNWKLLYNESPTGLIPEKMVFERGKIIEPFLSKHNYEVAGKYFANAGLQRSIALSFLCALIENHEGTLSFFVFDDPILSLDEDHRERWADNILAPQIEGEQQIILATHQYQFIKNCSHDFQSGNIIELNPRDTQRPLSWQIGNALNRVQDTLNSNWKAVPNLLRKYCEHMLIALQAYCEEEFYNPENLSSSIQRYKTLILPNPLVSAQRNSIVAVLEKNEVVRVLNPGSHNLTEDNLTKPMVSICFDLIKKVEGNFRSELKRLKRLRKRKFEGKIIEATLLNSLTLTFNDSVNIRYIGRAAARSESSVVDGTEQEMDAVLQSFACVHVTGNTFDPVARCGQCVLLSNSNDIPNEGDLVVGETSEQKKFLRRISFKDDDVFLYSINPLKITAPLQIDRKNLSLHRVIGVLYEPCKHYKIESVNGNEWHPCQNIDSDYFDNKKMIAVEGNSMEPIARKGQKVLVQEGLPPQDCKIESGGLAVIETQIESIGNEIKRVYPRKDNWVLCSTNPLEQYSPDIISTEKIKKVWPLKGVVFDSFDV